MAPEALPDAGLFDEAFVIEPATAPAVLVVDMRTRSVVTQETRRCARRASVRYARSRTHPPVSGGLARYHAGGKSAATPLPNRLGPGGRLKSVVITVGETNKQPLLPGRKDDSHFSSRTGDHTMKTTYYALVMALLRRLQRTYPSSGSYLDIYRVDVNDDAYSLDYISDYWTDNAVACASLQVVRRPTSSARSDSTMFRFHGHQHCACLFARSGVLGRHGSSSLTIKGEAYDSTTSLALLPYIGHGGYFSPGHLERCQRVGAGRSV